MNKLTRIAIAFALFTSLAVKAEEMAVEAAHEEPAELTNHLEAIPEYQALGAEQPAAEHEESILDQAVSTEEAELPQS